MSDASTADETSASGRTFADAVQERYADPLAESDADLTIGTPGCERKVDVRLTPHRAIERLTGRISLSGMEIAELGKLSQEMAERLKGVKELDLSSNLLPGWPLVTEILQFMPQCQELIVSDNPQMAYPCDFPYGDVITFKKRMTNVKSIVMAGCEYMWPWILCAALEVWPDSLQSLNLHNNEISEISVPPRHLFTELRSLDLSNNPITDWNQVCKLGSLPALQDLNVSDCQIDMIAFDESTNLFPKLKKLNLSSNKLECWINVVELRKLPSLSELNLKGNPILTRSRDYAAAFNQVLGRLSGLVKLNGEQVTPEMYREAEKYYLKCAHKEFMEFPVSGEVEDFTALHPRYDELVEIYGVPEERINRPKHVCVKLVAENGNEITKNLPYSTTVTALKVLMKRTFGVEPTAEVELVLKGRHDDEYEYVLKEDGNPISFYDVTNGDIILMKTK